VQLYSAKEAWLSSDSRASGARGRANGGLRMGADDDDEFDINDTPEKRALKARLVELRDEHRALDSAIAALQGQSVGDALQLARLKKRKLVLRDQIQWIEDRLTPDIIA
jgi:hypothetical protein